MSTSSRTIKLIVLLLLPTLAFAHPGHGADGSFTQALMHPLTGVDHLLAMLAVGIWGAQQGGRMYWLAPMSFVGMMLVGTALAFAGVTLPNVESNIAFSVVALGAAIAFALRARPIVGAAIVGTFAIFHGYAHGIESGGVHGSFIGGMVLTTAALHATGIAGAVALKRLLSNTTSTRVLRWTGVSIAIGGLALLAGA